MVNQLQTSWFLGDWMLKFILSNFENFLGGGGIPNYTKLPKSRYVGFFGPMWENGQFGASSEIFLT